MNVKSTDAISRELLLCRRSQLSLARTNLLLSVLVGGGGANRLVILSSVTLHVRWRGGEKGGPFTGGARDLYVRHARARAPRTSGVQV